MAAAATAAAPKKEVKATTSSAAPPVCAPSATYPGWHEFQMGGQKFLTEQKYKPIKVLGQGAYGIVISANDTAANKPVAIKKITRAFEDAVDGKRILREVKLLRHFDHRNIIPLRDLFGPPVDRPGEPFEDVYIVLGYMETDLNKIIRSKTVLRDEDIQYLVFQLLRALQFIHSANVLHRDLKPSNLLVNSDSRLKVCDLGLARGFNEDEDEMKTVYVVTRWYRAPELLVSSQAYDAKIDVWASGCILAEMLGRRPLFPGEDYMNQLTIIINQLGTPEGKDVEFITSRAARDYMTTLDRKTKIPFSKLYPAANPKAIDLLDKMLHFNPDRRCTVTEAMAHPYFAAFNTKPEPDCKAVFDFSFEKIEMNKAVLQDFMWEEVFQYRPGMRAAPPAGTPAVTKIKKYFDRLAAEGPAKRVKPKARPPATAAPAAAAATGAGASAGAAAAGAGGAAAAPRPEAKDAHPATAGASTVPAKR